jgi:regulator of sigma E protease
VPSIVSTVLYVLLGFVLVLGVNIFVHELGHFLAAKRVGIRVLKFQLGFNPTILSFKRGDTEYSLGALPLGGYVKMAGDSPEDVERDEHGNVVQRPDEFLSKSKWERFQVLIMGPTMNLLLALFVTAFVLYRGAEVQAYLDMPPVVGSVVRETPAAKSDLRPGDRILSVAGSNVDTWKQFYIAILSRPNRETSLTIQRDGREMERVVTPTVPPGRSRFEVGDIGVLPNVHPHLRTISPGEPGERAGLKAGDVILAVDGQFIALDGDFRDAIATHPEQPITITILRDGAQQNVTVTPVRHGDRGFLGVGPVDETKSLKPGPLEALVMSARTNVESAGLIFKTVWGLITRETSPKQLMGPVAIAQLSGESAQLGFIPLLSLMAMIALNLGLLNLLPIPILDGGHIFIMALEGVVRRDFSARVKEKMLLAGFVVLMMLMVTVIYNDLARISWINNLIPWR